MGPACKWLRKRSGEREMLGWLAWAGAEAGDMAGRADVVKGKRASWAG